MHLISESAREQLKGSEEMVKAIREIIRGRRGRTPAPPRPSRRVIEEQTAAVARMTSAAQELTNLSVELQNVVRRFRLGS